MEILRLLDQIRWIERYEVEDYRHWDGGFYYRLKIRLQNQSALFAREYVDEAERNYAFHWQDENDKMIMRWDNAPHYSNFLTFPHHKHTPEGVSKSTAVTLRDVLDEIGMRLKLD